MELEPDFRRCSQEEAKQLVRAERVRRELWYYNDEKKCRVNFTQEVRDAQDDTRMAVFNAPTATKKFEFMKLPYEIREMILEDLLVRPVGIFPGEVYHEVKTGKGKKEVVGVYSYQWATHLQVDFEEHSLPSYDGSNRRLRNATWLAVPSKDQLRLIEDCSFPEGQIFDRDMNSYYTRDIIHRYKDLLPPLLRGRADITISGIQPNILRACRDLYEQGRCLLYGKNTFVFDTKCLDDEIAWDGYEPDGEEQVGVLMLAYCQATERAFAAEAEEKATKLVQGNDKALAALIKLNPLAEFLHYITSRNSRCITSIELDGHFHFEHYYPRCFGLENVLPAYTVLLNKGCPGLRKLTIHQEAYCSYKNQEFWMIHCVRNVVRDMPHLQELQLGNDIYGLQLPRAEDWGVCWGAALEWQWIVEKTRLEKEKSEAAKSGKNDTSQATAETEPESDSDAESEIILPTFMGSGFI